MQLKNKILIAYYSMTSHTRRVAELIQNAVDGEVWHLDVGSSHPGAEVGPKGSAVRRLKWYVSWVQNVVRQFGPYPSRAQET